MGHAFVHITVMLLKALLASLPRDACISRAARQALATLENAEIDAACAAMATDEEYQREALHIAAEFERASWEALQLYTPP